MPVGDINSKAAGSGARYNDGKPDLALIPASIVAEALKRIQDGFLDQPNLRAALAIDCLADFQRDGNVDHLYAALDELKDPLVQAAHVFTYGKAKYAAWNWAKGMAWSIPMACAMRHALAIVQGEIDDPESKRPHEGHIACNVIMLIHFADYFQEGNDITFDRILPRELNEAA